MKFLRVFQGISQAIIQKYFGDILLTFTHQISFGRK